MANNNEKDDFSSFRDLTEAISNLPQVEPRADFTARIMARLPERPADKQPLMLILQSSPSIFRSDLFPGLRRPITQKECAFYFLLTGFFYLIFGAILIIGLKKTVAGLPVMGWLGMQPLFCLFCAFSLIALGTAVYFDGNKAVKAARCGTMVYAGLIFFNGLAGVMATHVPQFIFFSLTFAAAGIFMAILLVIAINCNTLQLTSTQERA